MNNSLGFIEQHLPHPIFSHHAQFFFGLVINNLRVVLIGLSCQASKESVP